DVRLGCAADRDRAGERLPDRLGYIFLGCHAEPVPFCGATGCATADVALSASVDLRYLMDEVVGGAGLAVDRGPALPGLRSTPGGAVGLGEGAEVALASEAVPREPGGVVPGGDPV